MKETYWVVVFPGGKVIQLKKLDYEKAVKTDANATIGTPDADYKIIGNKRVFRLGVNHFLIADTQKIRK